MFGGIIKQLEPVTKILDLGAYGVAFLGLFGISGAILMGWLSTHTLLLWNSFGLFGAIFVALITVTMLLAIAHYLVSARKSKAGIVGVLLVIVCGIGLVAGLVLIAKETPASADRTPPTDPSSLVSGVHFLKDDGDTIAAIGGRFAKDGTNMAVKLSYGTDVTSPIRTLIVDEIPLFRKGVDFRIPLVTYDNPEQKNVMRWGSAKTGPSEQQDRFGAVDPAQNVMVTISASGQDEEYFFILKSKINPMIVGSLLQRNQGSEKSWTSPWLQKPSQNLDVISEGDFAFSKRWSHK
jgi:hypothetical protein